MRILHYKDQTSACHDGVSAGARHTNRCGITVHFASSGPLALYKTGQQSPTIYTPSPGKILIFASDQLQLLLGGRLHAGGYFDDVAKKDLCGGLISAIEHAPLHGKTPWCKDFAPERMAVVFFAHLYYARHVQEALSREKHHSA